MVKIAALAAVLALSGCQDTVTHRERIRFSRGSVELVITSVGSAIDGEKYQLAFNRGEKSQTFFTGWDFSEFHVAERTGRIQIQMCKGHIEQADPIAITDTDLVWPELNWNCLDKSHEA
ncbi:hypothetical protein ACUXST_000547 [Sphingomonas sp. F9_3S_D5_B_2]